MKLHRTASASLCLLALSGLTPFQSPSPPPIGSKTWIGHHQEVEEYLRTAECIEIENFGPGTKVPSAPPMTKRCVLSPGGPVSRMLWKPLTGGVYRGFKEGSKADLAAYALDKLLKMDMVPPVVERVLLGHQGAATFWVEKVTIPSKEKPPGASEKPRWDLQLARMTMFDNLIGNRDRNTNNMLQDDAWNLILIDHTRAFGPETDLPHPMTRIDAEYWSRIEKMTRQELDTALGRWLGTADIAAILDRRAKMKAAIRKLDGQAVSRQADK